ncbi:MAG: hypothetical protein ACJ79A_04505 [Gemmatimonadaceae bacterium]
MTTTKVGHEWREGALREFLRESGFPDLGIGRTADDSEVGLLALSALGVVAFA